MNCPRCAAPLDEIYTNGVLVDFCPRCKGSWYDKRDLLFLSKQPRRLKPLLEGPLLSPQPSDLHCPRCQMPMERGGLGAADLLVDCCTACEGLWLDAGERLRLEKIASTRLADRLDRAAEFSAKAPTQATTLRRPAPLIRLPRLPNLAFRSTVVFLSLYGMVFLILLLAVEAFGVGLPLAVFSAIAVIAVQYLAAPFLMDFFLEHLRSTSWVSKEGLPAHLSRFIERVCHGHGIPFPNVGIIQDGNPSAFTYGHYPGNARLILTSGLIDILEEAELRAVVAHELGHAIHWDILVMTGASLVPILLYYLYEVLMRGEARGGGAPLFLVALLSYLCYWVAVGFVLLLSRVREYHADRFSARITQDPNALTAALVKIAYGLAAAKPEEAAEKERSPLRAIGALAIFNPGAALHLAVAAGGTRNFSQEDVVQAMQWDLWNPWARFYELFATHPLPAKRIKALGDLAWHDGQKPLVSFNLAKPESYWDEFFADLFIMALPALLPIAVLSLVGLKLVLGFTGLTVPRPDLWDSELLGALPWYYVPAFGLSALVSHQVWQVVKLATLGFGLGISAFGLGSLIRTLFSYRGRRFPVASVASLLKKVKVSAVRPVPVTMKGRVIGRGIPGLIYSDDLVFQDQTGIIFLDYRQPWKVFEFLFGLFRVPGIIGREVVVQRWYRRAPVPYVEMKRLADGRISHTCYVYGAKLLASILILAIGVLGIGLVVVVM